MKTSLFLLAFTTSQAVWAGSPPPPMTPTDAFNQGLTDGSTGAAAVSADINSTSASTNVDAYSTTNTNSSYFSNGNGDPRTPGAAQVTTCANTTFADPKVQAECTAINQIAGDRSVRPLTPLTPADPMLVLGRATATDPVSVAGAFAASYTGCSTQTVTTPPIYETDLCTEAKSLQPQTCTKTLTVTVTVSDSCTPGTWYGAQAISVSAANGGWGDYVQAYCDMNRNDGMLGLRFTPYGLSGICYVGYLDVPMATFSVTDSVHWGVKGTFCDSDGNCTNTHGYINYEVKAAHNYKGSCTVTNYIGYAPGYTQGCNNGVCTYTFSFYDNRWGDYGFGNTGALPVPAIIHTENDSWDTAACSILDARTLP